MDTEYRKIWNIWVVWVAWNNPPNKPMPTAKKEKFNVLYANKREYSETIMVFLLYSIDLSRLDVSALDSIIKIKENIVIVFLGVEPIHIHLMYIIILF